MTTPTSAAQLQAATPLLLSSALALCARILITMLFVLSGMSKMVDPGATIGYITSVGLPFPALVFILAVVTEILGGAALMLGYRTRWVAAVLAAFSVSAAVVFHMQIGDQDQLTHFLKNLAIAGGLLQIAAFGPGRFSLDARW